MDKKVAIVGAGSKSLHLSALLGLVAGMNIHPVSLDDLDKFGRQEPINTGRRADKDDEALRKAQARRDRKNAKRMEQAR